MTPRGGFRGFVPERKSRKLPTTKVSVYEITRDYLNNLSDRLKMPVVEILYRIFKHPDINNIINEIETRKQEDWHKQEI